jgi:hypothetical protein
VKNVFTSQAVFNDFVPGPHKPGKVFVFSDNLSWQSIDGTAVAGLAGTHSGTHMILRIADANDGALANSIIVWQYEATFVLNAVAHPGQQLAGQVTARGVWYATHTQLVDAQGQPLNPQQRRHAVTGGTGPYRDVRGQGFETPFAGTTKTLELDL